MKNSLLLLFRFITGLCFWTILLATIFAFGYLHANLDAAEISILFSVPFVLGGTLVFTFDEKRYSHQPMPDRERVILIGIAMVMLSTVMLAFEKPWLQDSSRFWLQEAGIHLVLAFLFLVELLAVQVAMSKVSSRIGVKV